MKELDRMLINKLIQPIEIYNNDMSHRHCRMKVDLYFTDMGMIDVPTEQEMLERMEEIRSENDKDKLQSA